MLSNFLKKAFNDANVEFIMVEELKERYPENPFSYNEVIERLLPLAWCSEYSPNSSKKLITCNDKLMHYNGILKTALLLHELGHLENPCGKLTSDDEYELAEIEIFADEYSVKRFPRGRAALIDYLEAYKGILETFYAAHKLEKIPTDSIENALFVTEERLSRLKGNYKILYKYVYVDGITKKVPCKIYY